MARNPLSQFRSGGGLFSGGDPFMSLHREMNRLFDDVYRGGTSDQGTQSGGALGNFVQTNMNVSETENEYRVTVEVPGVSEDDIDVRLENDILTIRGEKKLERSEGGENENYHFVERSYGSFQRSMRLPTQVDPERVNASCENGVLTITLPKAQQQERARRIELKRGKGSAESGKKQVEAQGREQSGGQDQTRKSGGRQG